MKLVGAVAHASSVSSSTVRQRVAGPVVAGRADAAGEVHEPVLRHPDAGLVVAGIPEVGERLLTVAEILVPDDADIDPYVGGGGGLLDRLHPAVEGAVDHPARVHGG